MERLADLETIRIPDGELADWFNRALQAAFKNTSEVQRQQRLALKKRAAEIEAMQARLLTAYFTGTIDESPLQLAGTYYPLPSLHHFKLTRVVDHDLDFGNRPAATITTLLFNVDCFRFDQRHLGQQARKPAGARRDAAT